MEVVTIVGVGEVGSVICSMLLAKEQGVTINLMDPEPSVVGRIMDLSHAAVANNNTIVVNNVDLMNTSEVLIYTAGVRTEKGANRSEMAAANKEIIKQIFATYQPKQQSVIISITNPCEPVVNWINEQVRNTGTLVLGTGTLLDTYRLKHLIAVSMDVKINEIETMVLGEHGNYMTPIYSQTFVQGEPILNLLNEVKLLELSDLLKTAATRIRQTELATKYGVAISVLNLMDAVFSKEQVEIIATSVVDINSILEHDSGVTAFSWPIQIESGSVVGRLPISLSSKEKEDLKLAYCNICEGTAVF